MYRTKGPEAARLLGDSDLSREPLGGGGSEKTIHVAGVIGDPRSTVAPKRYFKPNLLTAAGRAVAEICVEPIQFYDRCGAVSREKIGKNRGRMGGAPSGGAIRPATTENEWPQSSLACVVRHCQTRLGH